jgi:hypothetical protein
VVLQYCALLETLLGALLVHSGVGNFATDYVNFNIFKKISLILVQNTRHDGHPKVANLL